MCSELHYHTTTVCSSSATVSFPCTTKASTAASADALIAIPSISESTSALMASSAIAAAAISAPSTRATTRGMTAESPFATVASLFDRASATAFSGAACLVTETSIKEAELAVTATSLSAMAIVAMEAASDMAADVAAPSAPSIKAALSCCCCCSVFVASTLSISPSNVFNIGPSVATFSLPFLSPQAASAPSTAAAPSFSS
mmetsp:Transcript_53840/g.114381  ORF Transcript_53840/g.114381 Transcript_53840/m.114381 type:complete len:202 (-) Transcript_53840:1145-1750(-)